jgi:DNA-binding transcriptional LysR family regulator
MKLKRIEALWGHVHWLGVLAAMGSYTAAAKRLGVSKAAVSQRIAELEEAAGIPLVRRTTRSVVLTEAASQLVEATRPAFETIERGFVGVRDLAQGPRGLLRLTAPVALGRQEIVPRLPAFLNRHPDLRVELDLSDQLASLAKEGYDLAIRHITTVPETHVAWSLCSTRSWLVANRSYLRRRGEPADPASLSAHNCLHYPRGVATPSWSFEPAKGKGERISVAIHGSFAANNSEALREAALAGVGIALLPDFSAHREVSAGRLTPLLRQWRVVGSFGDQIYAIRPYSALVPRAVRAIVDHLRQDLREGFPL